MITKERFERQSYSTRVGSIAADFQRIASFSRHPESRPAVETMIKEARHFIEWTAPYADERTLQDLATCQRVLTRWHRVLASIWGRESHRLQIGETAQEWADVLLEDSGLLSK